jgi:hypothetical protein
LDPFTGSGVNHIGIRGRDVKCTNRGEFEVSIRHVTPIHAGIVGLPDSTVSGPEVIYKGIVGNARNREDTTTAVRSHKTPFNSGQKSVVDRGIQSNPSIRNVSLNIVAAARTCKYDGEQQYGNAGKFIH